MAQMTKLQEELEAIREAHQGLLRAEDVVSFAEANPDSELHKRFTWDNQEASRLRRLDEARGIIRMIVFVAPSNTTPVRTYVSLTSDRQQAGGGYRHLAETLNDKDRREMLLKQALREFVRWRQKYKALRELSVIFSSLDEVEGIEAMNLDNLDLKIDVITPDN